MTTSQPDLFGPALAALLREPGLTSLAVGSPRAELRTRIQAVVGDDLLAPHAVHDIDQANACRAGLWLYFDFFDESHRISQDLHTLEGSYWHAILHRREPDADNAKYWFRRVGAHPVFEPLRSAASKLAEGAPTAAKFLGVQSRWDAFAFVDLCEAARSGDADCESLCLAIQRLEWELLFEHCCRAAIGQGT